VRVRVCVYAVCCGYLNVACACHRLHLELVRRTSRQCHRPDIPIKPLLPRPIPEDVARDSSHDSTDKESDDSKCRIF